MNSVINHVAKVAIAAQPKVSGEKTSHARHKPQPRESGGMRYKFTHASQSMADSLEHPGKQ
jgi:hypothetical protein